MLHDWTTVHWKAYQNDNLVEDSRACVNGNCTPKVFRLGHYEVSKCWDIALQQMKAFGKAKIFCPGGLDRGGNVNQYGQYGSGWVHTNSDMTYEIDVLECGINPPSLQDEHAVKPMRSGECFYIVSAGTYGKGSNFAIGVSMEDKYAPKETGVYDIAIKEYLGDSVPNLAQQWYFDS